MFFSLSYYLLKYDKYCYDQGEDTSMLSKSDCGDSFNQTQVILNLQTNF